MRNAWIVSAVRTPIGKFLGAFSKIPAPELGAIVIREALIRASIEPERVNEVIMGNVLPAGIGQAPARQAALRAGLPSKVAALTINKVCGSGLKAVMLACQAIQTGDAEIVVAGGMENMSRAPHLLLNSRQGIKLGDGALKDSMIHDGLWCGFEDCHMGNHAEYIAKKYNVTREQQDAFAAESQKKAALAIEAEAFQNEIAPVPLPSKTEEILTADEGPRPETTKDTLAKLRPAFQADGSVTAGNASMLSDGAAAVLVVSEEIANSLNTPFKAKILASHTSGTDPQDLFIAPVSAVQGVLAKSKQTTEEIDAYELNEAFAAQMLACQAELNLDMTRVNVHGGAIALGHPIGASGARVLVTLLHALHQQKKSTGVASLCLGGGNAVAMSIALQH